MTGLFRRLMGRAETRSTESFGDGWDGLAAISARGGAVSPRMAENLAALLACVNAVASGIASLPAAVYRKDVYKRQAQGA